MAKQTRDSIYDGTVMLDEIKIPWPNPALTAVMTGQTGNVRGLLNLLSTKGKLLYQGKVAKKTGRLAESAESMVELRTVKKGEQRLVGVISVGGTLPESTWKKGPFFYGALHEFGREASILSGTHHPAHNDLVEVRDVLIQ